MAWRECRFLLTSAAKSNPAAPFRFIETNQVLRLQNPTNPKSLFKV